MTRVLGAIPDWARVVREEGAFAAAVVAAGFAWKVVRRRYYAWRVASTAASVGRDLRVKGPTRVTANTVLGENVHFNGMTIAGDGRVEIGDNFHSGAGCEIHTENHDYDGGEAIPFDGSNYVIEDVTVGDNVWFGSRVLVLPGVSIGEGAVIQAGAVVSCDVPKGAIAGGNPAEVFSYRDMTHYERLKAAGKFH